MEAIPIVAAKVLFRILLAAKMTAIDIEEHTMPDAIARQRKSLPRKLFTALVMSSTIIGASCFLENFQPGLNCAMALPTSPDDKVVLYKIGADLAKAVIAQEQGNEKEAKRWHDEAEDLANEFPFNVPDLPPRVTDPKSQYNQIVKYVVIDMKEVYELLQGRYTESESRIVQKAAKMGMLRFNYEPGSEIGDYALKILLKDYGGGLEASSIFYDLQKALESKKSRAEILKALDHTDKLGTDVNSYMLNMKMPPSVRMKFKKSEASSVSGNTNEANVSSSRREGSSNKVWSSFGGLSGKPTPIAQPPGGKTISTRADKLALWDMGSFIGAAALLNQSPDVPLSKAAQFYAWAEDIARKFQLQIAPLPARTGSVTKDTLASLTWATQGQYPLWNNLENKYGETERLDVELATKSQMLLLVYEQSGSGRMVCEEISKSFKENGEAAFPPRIWKPLTDAIDRKASKDEIKRRVADLDAAVRAWYDPSKPAPRN